MTSASEIDSVHKGNKKRMSDTLGVYSAALCSARAHEADVPERLVADFDADPATFKPPASAKRSVLATALARWRAHPEWAAAAEQALALYTTHGPSDLVSRVETVPSSAQRRCAVRQRFQCRGTAVKFAALQSEQSTAPASADRHAHDFLEFLEGGVRTASELATEDVPMPSRRVLGIEPVTDVRYANVAWYNIMSRSLALVFNSPCASARRAAQMARYRQRRARADVDQLLRDRRARVATDLTAESVWHAGAAPPAAATKTAWEWLWRNRDFLRRRDEAPQAGAGGGFESDSASVSSAPFL